MLSDAIIDIGFVYTMPKSNKFICLNPLKDEIILVTKNSKEFRNELLMDELKILPLLYAYTGDDFIKYIEEQINCKEIINSFFRLL